jgi:SSS family solute:Na+ symporter
MPRITSMPLHLVGKERFTDRQKVAIGRTFIVLVVAATYALSLFPPPRIFDLAVWCFSGFTGLFPLVLASVWWRRATKAGAIASVLTTAAVWSVLFWRGLVQAPGAAVSVDGDYLVWGMLPVTVILAASTVALVLVSLVTAPPPRALVDSFVFREGNP